MSVSDWPIIMIDPGGLLLVVPTYLLSQFQAYWWHCKTKYITELGCDFVFSQGHILSNAVDALSALPE